MPVGNDAVKDVEIDFEIFVYGDPTNTGKAVSIHPLSGNVWVELDNGRADYMHPSHITAVDEEEAFRTALDAAT